MKKLSILLALMCLAIGWRAAAAGAPGAGPAKLPRTHAYQKVLYKFMASVTEKDVTHGVTANVEVKPCDQDPEYLYRTHIFTLMSQPLVGTKRGTPAVNAPPACFVLPNIERADGVYVPPVWPEALMSFVQWHHPGNPFRDNRALKLRAFVGAAVQMLMFHEFAELNDGKAPPPIRPDWHGYNPVFWAAPYPGFRDVLPPKVRSAYETGLRMIGKRMIGWGIRGESCEDDLKAPLGLVYISRALRDPAFTKKVEAYVRPVFTDPRHIHSAGYWVERGGLDTGFGGTANLYAAWIALMTDWPFAKDALKRVYRLRGYLILPEPDGTFTGPSHFNSRLGSPANQDQWAWDGARDTAAAMITDEAVQFVKMPTPDQLKAAPAVRAHAFSEQLKENLRDAKGHYYTNSELTVQNTTARWTLRLWMTYNFPISLNPAYEFYRKGAWAHRQKLEKANSPLLKSPFLRGENFVRAFEKAFVVTRQPGFATILHTGPIGAQSPDDKKAQFAGPMGLSGGQLSAFWTPKTGSVILGLRVGMSYDKSFDLLDAWRTWPNHSVSGVTAGGKVFTSARITRPEVAFDITANGATVKVRGALVAMKIVKDPAAPDKKKAKDQMYDDTLEGNCDYARTFKIDGKGVSVKTTVSGDGKDSIAELYEVLPVYLGNPRPQRKAAPTAIAFQVRGAAGKWEPATAKYTEKVRAVKLTRFDGAVVVTFDQPRRAKLSPAVWKDNWINAGATARNVMIDLMENGDKPAALTAAKKISYRIEPAAK